MTQRTIYTCDFCKSEVRREDFLTIDIKVYTYTSGSGVYQSRHICNICAVSMKLMPVMQEHSEVKDTITLEELIRQIVREEIPR
jgi:hypothetical protein